MMRKIVFSELYKLFSKRLSLLLIFVLLALNCFFIYNSQIKGSGADFVSAEAKISLNNDIKKIPNNNKRLEFIENKLESVYDENAELYTGDSYSDRILLQGVKEQLLITSDYEEYVRFVINEADNLTSISIFADESSFSYKNALATAEDFSTLIDVNTYYNISYGVNMATDFVLTDLMVILLLFIVCEALIGSERSIGITSLQKTCKHGRGRLAFGKIAACFISVLIICVLFYGSNYIIAGLTYGFGDLSRSIQSVEGFANCPIKISVLEYLALFFAFKLLSMFLLCLIINLVSMFSKSRVGGYAIIAAVFLVSYILTAVIDDNSSAMCLKYMNLLTFTDTHGIISAYRNINIFGSPVNYLTAFGVFAVLLIAAFSILNIAAYNHKNIAPYSKYKQSLPIKFKHPVAGTSVVAHEMYKALVTNKAGLFILILIAVQIAVNFTSPLTLSEEEKFEKYYFSFFAGDFNNEKKDEMQAELERFEKSESELSALTNDYENGLISESEYLQQSAEYSDMTEEYQKFNKYVVPYYEYLCNQQEAGNKVSVMFYRGNDILLGLSGDLSNIYCLVLYAVIIICTAPLFTYEYEGGMINLLKSAKTGMRKLLCKKLLCSLLITLALNVAVYLPYFLRIIEAYGIEGLNNTAVSMPSLEGLPCDTTVLQVIIFVFAVRVLVSLVITAIIAAISVLAKNTIVAMAISILMFILPLLLPINNINILNDFSLYHLQNFSGLLSGR